MGAIEGNITVASEVQLSSVTVRLLPRATFPGLFQSVSIPVQGDGTIRHCCVVPATYWAVAVLGDSQVPNRLWARQP